MKSPNITEKKILIWLHKNEIEVKVISTKKGQAIGKRNDKDIFRWHHVIEIDNGKECTSGIRFYCPELTRVGELYTSFLYCIISDYYPINYGNDIDSFLMDLGYEIDSVDERKKIQLMKYQLIDQKKQIDKVLTQEQIKELSDLLSDY